MRVSRHPSWAGLALVCASFFAAACAHAASFSAKDYAHPRQVIASWGQRARTITLVSSKTQFSVRNVGHFPLTILDVEAGDIDGERDIAVRADMGVGDVLQPGKKLVLRVVAAHPHRYANALVYAEFAEKDGHRSSVNLRVITVPARQIPADPAAVSFDAGTGGYDPIVISNPTAHKIIFRHAFLVVDSGSANPWQVAVAGSDCGGTQGPWVIAAHQSCEVTVAYQPQARRDDKPLAGYFLFAGKRGRARVGWVVRSVSEGTR